MNNSELNAVDLLPVVTRVLGETNFANSDIGPINAFPDIDFFVLSWPKCGTTALQRGFEAAGKLVLHAHDNLTTYEAFPNGEILRANGIRLETIVRARMASSSRPLHLFFGYREPVSWYLSMAGQFGITLDGALRAKIVQNMEGGYPWSKYKIATTAAIVCKATGINPLKHAFDSKQGYTVVTKGNFTLVSYRFDRLQSVRDYIVSNVTPNFTLEGHRVNSNPLYKNYADNFTMTSEEIENLYCDKWFQHFYTPHERDVLIEHYTKGRRLNSAEPAIS